MNKSYRNDVQLLTSILQNQQKIKDALLRFGCNEYNLEGDIMAFDLCAFYISQIGETAKMLTDNTKQSFKYFDPACTKYFRNMVDHVYEKINRKYLCAFIFNMVSNETIKEVKQRRQYCMQNAK